MSKLSWLLLFILSYWSYCIYWGWRGARQARTASDYFLANRSIGLWVFVLAATATSFSGWTFVGHPGTIYSVGLPYAFASFYAITISLTGVIFLKRQWLLGKRYGYITPGEMFSDYYRTDWMRLLTVLVAMVFSVPYLGIQLRASGLLFNRLLEGTALEGSFVGTIEGGAILLSIVVFIYVASGGLRSVAYVDCAQCILLALGIVILGLVALDLVGGWASFKQGLAGLARGWGILFNLLTTVLVSAFTQPQGESARHRDDHHEFIRQHTGLRQSRRRWKKPIWALTVIWFLFAIGPFAVLGNEPDPAAWSFGIPSLWIWQIVWWIVGCVVMYLLAFKLEMSTAPDTQVEPLQAAD